MFLTGSFTRTLDEKHRIAIPKTLRDCLDEEVQRPLFAAPGTDGSLAVYPENAFTRLAEHLASHSPTARDVRDYRRLFFSQATATKIDRQGRLRLPKELAEWANLGDEVVLLGVQDHLEIWNRGAWDQFRGERRDHYDQIAERAFGAPQEHSPFDAEPQTYQDADPPRAARPR